ncbi:laccase [Fomitiporia mediterranea MF3/22]|uniref:laccase n=1 Tax=Fomitiporia mediterranea (strain MF3/22) TaxID=694068 RepID=UPI0004409355|nr:laccase [Fomitiporia mediterranea MF3/22]EJD08221.1 laccase [Fomitiporia mediterranea MF3/22]
MQKLTFLSSAVALTLSTLVHGKDVPMDLHIVNTVLAPDGFNRSTVVANGQFPGPLIKGNVGDRFKINVFDELKDPSMRRATSIHWHGLFQKHQSEFDGPAWVTQCPIIPEESFLYDFSVPDQSGTYWYHSHLSTQYCDGLRGPLVIYDPNDPLKHMYDVDNDDTILTIGDWYHDPAPSMFPNPKHVDPIEKATTVNGKGRYPGGPKSPLSVTSVKKGLRYRLRFISAVCGPTYNVSIDGHQMTIIEADGIETEPLTVDSLQIFASQRYSVVVTADQPIDNYWIRVIPTGAEAGNGTNESFVGGLNAAILRYEGANNTEPTSEPIPNGVPLNEADLAPLINPGAPGGHDINGADYNITLTTSLDLTTGLHLINGIAYEPPKIPILLQVLSGVTDPRKLLPKGSVIGLPRNKVIQVELPGGFPHPFHLHGHAFDVIRTAGSDTYNFKNPPRRDVVNIGNPGDLVTIRFVTDNPGPWFFHCHIDWHLEAGLAVVFAEGTDDIKVDQPVDSQWQNLCPNYYKNDPDTQFEDNMFKDVSTDTVST